MSLFLLKLSIFFTAVKCILFDFFYISLNKSHVKSSINILQNVSYGSVRWLVKCYVGICVCCFNLLIYWPIGFVCALVRFSNFFFRTVFLLGSLFLVFLVFSVESFKFSGNFCLFDVSPNLELSFFDPIFFSGDESVFLSFFEFCNLNFSFLHAAQIENILDVYYDSEALLCHSNRNFFLHKAVFSDLLKSKYVTHTTNSADWYHHHFFYNKGWLTAEELYSLVREWEFLKNIIALKNYILFFIFNYLPCDIVLIHLKYKCLTLLLKQDSLFFLAIFKFIVIVSPDTMLLSLGFNYKYFLVICVDYIFDHIFGLTLKIIKLYEVAPGNYILKKKLMLLTTDIVEPEVTSNALGLFSGFLYVPRRKSAELLKVYPFLIDLKTSKKYNLSFFAFLNRNFFGNVIESTPFVEDRYDVYYHTGFTNPRSYSFYSKELLEEATRADLYARSYRLSTWNFASKLERNLNFFSKEDYFLRKNSNSGLTFFAGDKSFLLKQLPEEFGWMFKGPYSLASTHLSYTTTINTLDNSGMLKISKRLGVATNPYINTAGLFFFRSTENRNLEVFPLSVEATSNLFLDSYSKRELDLKDLEGQLLKDDLVDLYDYVMDPFKALVSFYLNQSLKDFYASFSSLEGDFSFAGENFLYCLPFAQGEIIFDEPDFETLESTFGFYEFFNDTTFNMTQSKSYPEDVNDVTGDKVLKSHIVPYEDDLAIFPVLEPFPLHSSHNYFLNFDKANSNFGSVFDLYDVWSNSLIDSSFLGLEVGKVRLQTEDIYPKLYNKRHVEKTYNLRYSSVLLFFFKFFYFFVGFHILLLNFVIFLKNEAILFYVVLVFMFLFFFRVFFLLYFIDLDNRKKLLYYQYSSLGYLYEKLKIQRSFGFFGYYFQIWGFSVRYRLAILHLVYKEFLMLFFKRYLVRSRDVFFEFVFFFQEYILTAFIFIFFFFLKSLYFRIIECWCLLRVRILQISLWLLNHLFLATRVIIWIYRNQGVHICAFILSFRVLLYVCLLVMYFFKCISEIVFVFCVFSMFWYSFRIGFDVFDVNITFFYPTYFILLFIFGFVLFLNIAFKGFQQHVLKSPFSEDLIYFYDLSNFIDTKIEVEQDSEEDDVEEAKDDDRDDSEEDEDEESNEYDLYNYTFNFNNYRYLMKTSEGVVATDVIRPDLYVSDIKFLRAFYLVRKRQHLRKNLLKESSKLIHSHPFQYQFFDNLRTFSILEILKQLVSRQEFFYHSRFLRPFYIWLVEVQKPLFIIMKFFGVDLVEFPRHLELILRNNLLKLYLGFYSYTFHEEDEYLPLYENDIFLNRLLRWHFVPGVLYYKPDLYFLKSSLIQNDPLDLDEEEFYTSTFWLDQFFYTKSFDIDLSDLNPVLINRTLRKVSLSSYSESRLEFLDDDVLDTNSGKFRFYILNVYSRSKNYLRVGRQMPLLSRFAYMPYHFLPVISKFASDIDYDFGLNVGFVGYFRRAYLGFQLHDSFFSRNVTGIFVKVISPYECFDNIFKLRFFENLHKNLEVLSFSNFPNLTKKEYENLLFYLNCTEQQWDTPQLFFDKKNTEFFVRPYESTEFPVFLFMIFLYYLQENRFGFFWSFNRRPHQEFHKQSVVENTVMCLEGNEPTLFSTKMVLTILRSPFVITEKLACVLGNPGILHENIWVFFKEIYVFIYLWLDFCDLYLWSHVNLDEGIFDYLLTLQQQSFEFCLFFLVFCDRVYFGFFLYDFTYIAVSFLSLLLC